MWGPQPWGFRDTQISHHLRILSRSLCNVKKFRMSHPLSLLKWIGKKELGRKKWRRFKGIVEIVDYEKIQDLEVKSVSLTLVCYSGELY